MAMQPGKQKGVRTVGKLAALGLKSKPVGLHGDGGGLWLQVTPNGRGRSWVFRYSFAGRTREMGLGSLDTVGLSEARDRAAVCRRLLLGTPTTAPVDPIEHRRTLRAAARVDAAKATTFRECADAYIDAHHAGWRNPKHAAQWTATLQAYVYPIFGNLPVQAVDVGLVLKAIEPIWPTKPETASRVRGRIEAILDWAAARGYRQGENPARWRGHLDKLLAAPTKAKRAKREKAGRDEHHAAMPYSEIGAFMAELGQRNSNSARALEYVVLTAMRTETVLGARAKEIDFDSQVWLIPAGRPGLKRPGDFRLPLSDAALAVLQAMGVDPVNDPDRYLFPGSKSGRPLTNILKYLKDDMRRPAYTVHGFRSTFRDWVGDCTDFDRDLAELALAHTVGDKVEQAYRRADGFLKRRRLMDAWAKFCATPSASGNVVSIHAATA